MAKWFYNDQDGKRKGPVSGQQIKSLVTAGEMTPETAVFTEDGLASVAGKIQGLSPKTPENESWFHPDVEAGRESGWSTLLNYTRFFRELAAILIQIAILIFAASVVMLLINPIFMGVVASAILLVGTVLKWLFFQILYNFVCLKVSEEDETRRQTMLLKEILILLQRQNEPKGNSD